MSARKTQLYPPTPPGYHEWTGERVPFWLSDVPTCDVPGCNEPTDPDGGLIWLSATGEAYAACKKHNWGNSVHGKYWIRTWKYLKLRTEGTSHEDALRGALYLYEEAN